MTAVSVELIVWARWTLAGVMVVASFGKLADRDSFDQAVINYQIFSRAVSRVFAHWVPWLELISAALLLLVHWSMVGALLSGMLLASFSVAAILNIARGRRINCGCMGKLTSEQIGGPLLFRNFLLVGLAFLVGFSSSVQANVSVVSLFPLFTLVVSTVILLTLFGPGLDFLRKAFKPADESGDARLKEG